MDISLPCGGIPYFDIYFVDCVIENPTGDGSYEAQKRSEIEWIGSPDSGVLVYNPKVTLKEGLADMVKWMKRE
jgi:hypothetical protein